MKVKLLLLKIGCFLVKLVTIPCYVKCGTDVIVISGIICIPKLDVVGY